ncbi:MAG TPA: VCBS repeat-containing protein, partial [Urbifossiella sp.]|nr:VCBS repeat-containing protein [Urbifossiella sp.]
MTWKRPTRGRILAAAVAAGAVVWAGTLLTRRPGTDALPGPPAGQPWFEDRAAPAGVGFRHFDPATPLNQIPETMGSGVAWIDYDADGWFDLFCVQAGPLPPGRVDDPPTHKLYRNNRDGTFSDVTVQAGLDRPGFGTGVAVGDYDNDGFDDLVVTALGGVSLFHNVPAAGGGRRFVDVAAAAGLSDPHYATSCAWGDLDGDGALDLYVCNYVEIDPARPVTCRHEGTGRVFQCSPTAYPATTHRLYRNNRDGTFTDVSGASGVGAARPAPGLGVVIADLDGDGRPDVYVANDLHPAYLFRNKGGWAFDEVALRSGCGLGEGGARIAGMGVEAGDLDGSGRPSLFVTNFQNAPNTVFLNRGGFRFDNGTTTTGLGPPSLNRLGFGTVLFDADLDGNPDLA